MRSHPQEGATPLYMAVQNGHVECVLLLINCGAGVNTQDIAHGKAALHQVGTKVENEGSSKMKACLFGSEINLRDLSPLRSHGWLHSCFMLCL